MKKESRAGIQEFLCGKDGHKAYAYSNIGRTAHTGPQEYGSRHGGKLSDAGQYHDKYGCEKHYARKHKHTLRTACAGEPVI